MFKAVESKVNLPQIEKRIIEFWKQKNIFERSMEARRNGPRFTFYEGPPTANGSPGIHHVLSRVYKDLIPRYRTMKGYYTPRKAGWDTHGLPVELEVEKELGFSGKSQIEEYGIEKFNARCRESVFRYLKEWETLTERIAFWVDMDNAYRTMDNSYIETGWWAIKQMWDKGLVYLGYKTTAHCPRCSTSISSHEVALGYRDGVEDPSVYVKFRVAEKQALSPPAFDALSKLSKPAYLLAWTTTPWTLPGNTALAVSPDAEYVAIESDNEYLILASARLEAIGLSSMPVAARFAGREFTGLHYEPLYEIPIAYGKEDKKRAYSVIQGNFVSMEDGTGIVHVAPAYGEIDFEVGEKEGLPLVHTVDLNGMVQESSTGLTPNYRKELMAGTAAPMPKAEQSQIPGTGKFVKDADKDIIADLEARGLLFRSETIRHTYPFCWRCGTPLLYYVKNSWYIKTTAKKDRLLAGNEEINWYPGHIKHGRFGDWLQNNVDWAFSRERYWGTPLPIWYCESCCSYECIGSLDELKNKAGFSGFPTPLDLHRPYVDAITFNCTKCGSPMRRLPEVIDCWFDSGNMPIAQWHYPFENANLFENGRFPADFICEAVDQTRGWFYSLHAISTMLFDRPSYRNVICLGLILDEKGEKMSKSRGNVVEPFAVIDKYGADILRWYLITDSPPGNARRFSEKGLLEITRSFLLTLWNIYSFFVMYANIDRYTPSTAIAGAQPTELDRWITSELNQLIADVDADLEHYDPTGAGRKIERFVDELSTWYVRRSRRRFWKSENDVDKLAAYNTLYECLVSLAKLLAPFTPFLAEELYQNLVRSANPDAPESVHLTDFPVADIAKIDQRLSADTRLVMNIVSLGRAARSKAGIRVRQPLAHVIVSVANAQEETSLERLKSQLLEELNVKDLKFGKFDEVAKLGSQAYVVSGLEPVEEGEEAAKVAAVYLAAVPTQVSPELAAEGMAREIVHRLQTMRRSANFEITNHITTYYQGDSYIKEVVEKFADYIQQETLSDHLVETAPEEGAYSEKFKLDKHEVLLGVKRG